MVTHSPAALVPRRQLSHPTAPPVTLAPTRTHQLSYVVDRQTGSGQLLPARVQIWFELAGHA